MSNKLSAAEILAVWERGDVSDALARATALWTAATGADAVDTVTIGARDRALLLSRIATFGPAAASYVECPQCAAELEFELDLRALVATETDKGLGPHSFEHDGWEVEFRLPSTADLRAVATEGGGLHGLLARSVVSATHDGTLRSAADTAGALVDVLDAEMRRLDPQAEIDLKLDCAACQHHWVARFDIAHFFWREVEVEATRLFGEIHHLARAYGWSESEILGLSPARRHAYLALLAGGYP